MCHFQWDVEISGGGVLVENGRIGGVKKGFNLDPFLIYVILVG